ARETHHDRRRWGEFAVGVVERFDHAIMPVVFGVVGLLSGRNVKFSSSAVPHHPMKAGGMAQVNGCARDSPLLVEEQNLS
ncbi:hypothetical protein, partial [Salmonella enterica]|uniref:hypothetical protein n=1 Tax=Salmonella enterica TaxID=28901 RepID=UPI0032B3CB6A